MDNYVKIEKDKIYWINSNQKKIHVDSYDSVKDYIAAATAVNYCEIGKYVILLSTFIGSPLYMMQSYQDAMTIVRRFGKPDLFITMTCNPNCKEIQENLLPGQHASGRPDIVTRIFVLKKHIYSFHVSNARFSTVS